MIDSNPPIVVVGFNRPKSLKRVLRSLANAYYPKDNIPLIISIDRGKDNGDVVEIANQFEWKFGKKIVKYAPENLGLRKHILQCGDLSLEYGSVIVLEDDLYVSPNFYYYTIQSLKFSEDKDYIGGISLYNHQTNVHTNDSFLAVDDGFDNWYFQFASSWGQAWTKDQWEKFKKWYKDNDDLSTKQGIPRNVTSWSNKSWLKYFIAFLIDTETYFLYPKISLTTNFSDAGSHVNLESTGYQVSLLTTEKRDYAFGKLDDAQGIYDAFYENTTLGNYLGIPKEDLCVDLYGYHTAPGKRFWLTSSILDYKIVKSFSRSLRPMELNVMYDVPGKDFFLYDTDLKAKNHFGANRYKRIMYSLRHVLYKDLKFLFWFETKAKFKRLSRKVLRK